MLHGHGDDGYRYTTPLEADFSTNVWYGGEPAGLKEHLFIRWSSINRYPEVLAESLARQAARHHGLDPGQVLVNSGTTESIYLIAQAYAGQSTTLVIPAFSEYEDACRQHGHKLAFLDWDRLTELPPLTDELVFICNPNNPTGACFGQLEAWMSAHPRTLFVVDEAFIDFTRQCPSAVPLLARFDNLLVMRSLTKTYAIPGLRLGYVLGSAAAIDRLKSCKQPWTVNSLALEAGKFIFEHLSTCQLPLDKLLSDKEHFCEALRQNPGIRIYPSGTHFFLAETRTGTAGELKAFLLEKHRLLIRDASNFRGLGPGHFRLATLAPEQNQRLVNALAAWTS